MKKTTKKKKKEPRAKTITFRLTDKQMKQVQRAAKRAKMNRSEFMRVAALSWEPEE